MTNAKNPAYARRGDALGSARGTTSPPPSARVAKRGLYVRFVTRMSGPLSAAVANAARDEGLTARAWVRRILMEKVDVTSSADARSGRPIRRPEDEVVALSAAIRALAAAASALNRDDRATARENVDRAREVLVPLVLRRAER